MVKYEKPPKSTKHVCEKSLDRPYYIAGGKVVDGYPRLIITSHEGEVATCSCGRKYVVRKVLHRGAGHSPPSYIWVRARWYHHEVRALRRAKNTSPKTGGPWKAPGHPNKPKQAQ